MNTHNKSRKDKKIKKLESILDQNHFFDVVAYESSSETKIYLAGKINEIIDKLNNL